MRLIPTQGWVRCSQNRSASVESGDDSTFGDADSLLFKGLVYGDPIVGTHLVQFVNTGDPFVREHESASF